MIRNRLQLNSIRDLVVNEKLLDAHVHPISNYKYLLYTSKITTYI